VTYYPDFKITIIQRQITRKWYNIELYYNGRAIDSRIWSWTLNDRYPRFQGQDVLDAEYLRNNTRYRHSFNGILIGTYRLPTQQSFRMTLSDLEWLSKMFSDKKRCAVFLRQLSFLFKSAYRLYAYSQSYHARKRSCLSFVHTGDRRHVTCFRNTRYVTTSLA